jgi:hypothetical protein
MYTKNEISHTKICDFLEARAPKSNSEFIILDFEIASQNAFKKNFLDTVYRCLFYYSQNI